MKFIKIVFILFASIHLYAGEIFRDLNFENGFNLTALNSGENPVEIGTLFVPDDESDKKPVWRIAQWGSKFSLIDAQMQNIKGENFYENKAKKVSLKKEKNDTVLSFFINAFEEFADGERTQGADWPHLLLEQKIEPAAKISEMKKFKLSFDIKISKPEKMKKAKYLDNLHAAQYVMFFTIQNLNKESKGYGDFLWFGIPIYDSRHKFVPEYKAIDGGKDDASGKYIHILPGKDFWKKSLDDDKWHTFNNDLLKQIKITFKDAQKKNFLKECTIDDMYVTSMNTGWEVTGTFKVSSSFSKLGLHP